MSLVIIESFFVFNLVAKDVSKMCPDTNLYHEYISEKIFIAYVDLESSILNVKLIIEVFPHRKYYIPEMR